MRATTYLAVPAVALSMIGVGFADGAQAAHRAKTKVTITVVNTDFYGKVKSKKPYKCSANRTVYLMLQVGKRGGGNDELFASDTTDFSGGAYRWNLQDYAHEGKFYAKVLRTPQCKGDTSRTVVAKLAES